MKLVVVLLAIFAGRVQSMINLSDVSCGSRRVGRIIGGSDAARAEFPWLVSMTRRGGHYCGATILSKRWLLTAAHCICSGTNEHLKPGQIRVTLGEHDLSKAEEPKAKDVRIGQIVAHPRHKCGRPSDDIALIRLAEDITWSESVNPACLPDGPSGNTYSDFTGKLATVAGWGWLDEISAKGGRANVLQKVEVNVLRNNICQEWYSSQGKKTKINPGQMCAGDEQGGKDSCWADSGGPLMSNDGSNSMVIGVVSTGIGCGRPRLPGLYTRISEYIDWIQDNVRLG